MTVGLINLADYAEQKFTPDQFTGKKIAISGIRINKLDVTLVEPPEGGLLCEL